LTPRMFSFNNPLGACEECSGLGMLMELDPDLIIPNKLLSLSEGAVSAPGWSTVNEGSVAHASFTALAREYDFSMDTPIADLDSEIVDAILYGTGDKELQIDYKSSYRSKPRTRTFEGIIPNLYRRYTNNQMRYGREEVEKRMSDKACPKCDGARLSPKVLAVKVGGKNIHEVTDMPIRESLEFFNDLELTEKESIIAEQVLKELRSRLKFLVDVGLDYLNLARSSGTLSGGEAQRIRLATQIGSGLVGVLYVLDEPSIGLHQRDNARLIGTLERLRDLGNTLTVVEHEDRKSVV